METRKEYLERYLQWLRIQKGKALRADAKLEVDIQIRRVKSEIELETKIEK